MSTPLSPECTHALSHVSSYLDADLDAGSCEAIEQHCRQCAHCAAIVEGLKKTVGLCRRLGATPLPPAVLDRARASLRRLLEPSTE
jgi:hypothetical protein